ncbi:resolvase [Synechococcus sp. H70.2]|uniref:resolvase n=1 Tax=Synechococcus sp. H70.2 TaxID=2964528 RepID=UPI0039C073A2
MERVLVGFDPGRDKCGLAVVQTQPAWQVLHREVVPAGEALPRLGALWQQFGAERLILGNQTTARQWKAQLESLLLPQQIVVVDERHSSEEARRRYWEVYQPRGWQRLLPKGLRVPDKAYDDLVALILVERYWRGQAAAKPT